MINTLGKIARCKINSQQWVAFLHPNDQQAEKEIREISFRIALNNIQCPNVTLTKQVKDLCDGTLRNQRKHPTLF